MQRHHGATLSCRVVAAAPMAIDVVAQNTTDKNDTHDCDEVLRIVLVARPMRHLSHATARDPWRGSITSSQKDRGASYTRVMRTTSSRGSDVHRAQATFPDVDWRKGGALSRALRVLATDPRPHSTLTVSTGEGRQHCELIHEPCSMLELELKQAHMLTTRAPTNLDVCVGVCVCARARVYVFVCVCVQRGRDVCSQTSSK